MDVRSKDEAMACIAQGLQEATIAQSQHEV